jgi:hypothetical protein
MMKSLRVVAMLVTFAIAPGIAHADKEDNDTGNREATVGRESSAPRILLDQGYTIVDVGHRLGSRRLVVTQKAETLSIVEEYSLSLGGSGKPACIVERDYSADYSLAGDTPLLQLGTSSTKEQSSLIMLGTVEFRNGEALTKWTSYTERGFKLETPRQQQTTVKPPPGPLVIGNTVQVVGPILLPKDGERIVGWVNFDDKTPPGKPLIEYKSGCNLRRTSRPAGAGFTIALFEPDSNKPEITVEYDAQGKCESIQLGSATVMKPR